jgi:hypothetical protein
MAGLTGRSNVVFDAIVSNAQRLGLFDKVNQFEPKSAPGLGVTCAVFAKRIFPDPRRSGLATTSGVVVWNVRPTLDMMHSPPEEIDPILIDVTSQYIDQLHSELDLGDPGSSVDVFGMAGIPIDAQFGYFEQDKRFYRIVMITVPVIIADVWIQH